MRIRKIGQVTPSRGSIVDSYNTSTTDGYSANYINNHSVVVSPTEPTTDRKKVWLRHTKNLFNKNDVNLNCYVNKDNGTLITNYSNNSSDYMKVSGQYVVVSGGYDTDTYALYDNNKTYLRGGVYTNGTAIDVTNASYIRITVKPAVMNTFQLELGETSTTYEPYVQDKTYILNENNVYDEYAPQNETYSTNEIRIGTYLGKPLYRKVVLYTNTSTIGASGQQTDINIAHNINNLGFVRTMNLSNINSQVFPRGSGSSAVTSWTGMITYNNTNLVMRIVNDTWSSRTWHITVEYTKTSD